MPTSPTSASPRSTPKLRDVALMASGSLFYASPEQLSDQRALPSSDQYSFAVTVRELLTGEVPLDVHDAVGPHDRAVPTTRSIRPDLPDGVDVVLRTAGAARPDDRFATMAEMLLAWRQAVGVPAGARTTADVGVAPSPRVAAARTLTQIELASINPYKGIEPFREADRIDFHGRSALIDHLAAQVAGNRFVTVVGPSGSGKSSLVRAGLVPKLREDDRVLVVTMVPGAHPLDELSIALSRVATRAAPIDPVELARARGINRAVRNIAPDGGELVLVVDQLEELWTSSDPTEREQLLAGLAAAVDHPHSALRVVATMRADFFDRPLEDPAIGTLVAGGTFGVTPMAPDELLDAIVAPGGTGRDLLRTRSDRRPRGRRRRPAGRPAVVAVRADGALRRTRRHRRAPQLIPGTRRDRRRHHPSRRRGLRIARRRRAGRRCTSCSRA